MRTNHRLLLASTGRKGFTNDHITILQCRQYVTHVPSLIEIFRTIPKLVAHIPDFPL